jgi:hypothetical protein
MHSLSASPVYFDTELLYFSRWMNGQHLRSFPTDELIKAFEDRWKDTGVLQESESGFAKVKVLSFFVVLALLCTWGLSILEVHIKGSHMPKHPTHCLIPVAVLFGNCNGKHNKATKKRVIRII